MVEEERNKKVLLMGSAQAGKTSMRCIIFANFMAKDTMRLGFTVAINESKIRFLGNLCLSIWDCGGQDKFMEHYFESQKETVFRNVHVLIYVFDIESREPQQDLKYYNSCINAIKQNSEQAHVFVLIHKMDLIAFERREEVFKRKKDELEKYSQGLNVNYFKTSIWDETLFQAWSEIVYLLIPNIKTLESKLQSFCDVCSADEVVLFEKSTFLVISSARVGEHEDIHRFEKISNIIKQFKLSCTKTNAQFSNMMVKNSQFIAFIDEFTTSTYIMVIMSDPEVQPAATMTNILSAKKYFESIVAKVEE